MIDYDEMSDFDINKLVAFAIDYDGDIESVTQRESKFKCIANQALVKIKGITGAEAFNPCNNPLDAWQIIVDNGISVQPTGDSWISGSSILGSQFIDKKPLRAAMICFLKMKDTEND